MSLTIGSLCTGYGGLDAAVSQHYDARTVWLSEVDKNANQILTHHYPDVPNLGDLTVIDWDTVPKVDILTAGYPCQPFSQAGKRKGTADVRHLWPHIARAVDVLRPRICVFENVQGHLSKGGVEVVESLTAMGYSVRWGLVRASDAGAPHRRARVFIVATAPDESGYGREQGRAGSGQRSGGGGQPAGDRPETRWCRCDACTITHQVIPWAAPAASPDSADPDRAAGQEPDLGSQQPGQSTPHGHNVERLGVRRDAAADTGGQRHGPGEDTRTVGRLDGADESEAREWERSREEPGHRSATATTDTDEQGPQGRGIVGSGRASERATRTHSVEFGPYEAAIRRWESVLGRPAPEPTVPTGRNGGHRLNPQFVEWMMGLPEGWVTDTGISHVAQLKALGNGVVPQQALLALQHLTNGDH